MFGMAPVKAAQFDFHPVARQRSPRPATGATGEKGVSRLGQVDEMYAAGVQRNIPVVGVAENEGFHLPVPVEELLQRRRIFQPKETCRVERMMAHD